MFFFDLLDYWYKMPDKNPEALQKAFPVNSTQDCKTEINALFQFNQQSKINYTPALIYNGRLLSQLYSYQDLYGIVRASNADK